MNCIKKPVRMKRSKVGMIPRVLKTKGKARMPVPITVFMSMVTDRNVPIWGWRYLP